MKIRRATNCIIDLLGTDSETLFGHVHINHSVSNHTFANAFS